MKKKLTLSGIPPTHQHLPKPGTAPLFFDAIGGGFSLEASEWEDPDAAPLPPPPLALQRLAAEDVELLARLSRFAAKALFSRKASVP